MFGFTKNVRMRENFPTSEYDKLKVIIKKTNGGFCIEQRLVYFLVKKMAADKEVFVLDFVSNISPQFLFTVFRKPQTK